jgi:hypothetical protein
MTKSYILILALLLFLTASFAFPHYATIYVANQTYTIPNDIGMCYQESANVSTSCGGLDTGAYASAELDDIWVDIQYASDENWDTYIQHQYTTGGGSYFWVNYTKPTGSLITSVWQVKDGAQTINYSIPAECWDNSNTLQFQLTATWGSYLNYYCYNSTDWVTLEVGVIGVEFYEEGMYWDIGQTYPRDTILDVNYLNISDEDPDPATYNISLYNATDNTEIASLLNDTSALTYILDLADLYPVGGLYYIYVISNHSIPDNTATSPNFTITESYAIQECMDISVSGTYEFVANFSPVDAGAATCGYCICPVTSDIVIDGKYFTYSGDYAGIYDNGAAPNNIEIKNLLMNDSNFIYFSGGDGYNYTNIKITNFGDITTAILYTATTNTSIDNVSIEGATFNSGSTLHITSGTANNIQMSNFVGNEYSIELYAGVNITNSNILGRVYYDTSTNDAYLVNVSQDCLGSWCFYSPSGTSYIFHMINGSMFNSEAPEGAIRKNRMPIDIQNYHIYNTNVAVHVEDSNEYSLSLTNVVIDNPNGDYQNYSNISLYNDNEGTWDLFYESAIDTPPATQFGGFINITPTSETPVIDNLTFSWLDNELIWDGWCYQTSPISEGNIRCRLPTNGSYTNATPIYISAPSVGDGDVFFNFTIPQNANDSSILNITIDSVSADRAISTDMDYTGCIDYKNPGDPLEIKITIYAGMDTTVTCYNTTDWVAVSGGWSLGSGSYIEKVEMNWAINDSSQVNYNESDFKLWQYDAGGWVALNSTPDTTNNQLSIFNFTPASDYGILEGDAPPTIYFTDPTPSNATNNFTYGMVFNWTGDTAIGAADNYIEIDGVNNTCTPTDDNLSCSYTLSYAEHFFNHTYSVIGYANISGTYYPTNETRTFDYYGCGNINTNATLIGNVSRNNAVCFALNATSLTLDGDGYYITGGNIFVNYPYSTIKNTNIKDYVGGGGDILNTIIRLNTSYNNIINNTITNGSATCIDISSAHNNTIANNTISNGCAYPIFIRGNNNTIKNNTISTYISGIAVFKSNNTDIIDNTVSGGYYVYGGNATGYAAILIMGNSTYTYITNNHIYNNSDRDLMLTTMFTSGGVSTNHTFVNNLTIDSPAGNYENYSIVDLNVSLISYGSWISLKWPVNTTTLPTSYSSFENKFVNITGNATIDGMVFNWLDSELDLWNTDVVWWNTSWSYRAPCYVNTTVTSSLANFPAHCIIDTNALITAGKMNTSCQDLRVVSSSDSALNYEIENGTCNTTTTAVWLGIPATNATGNDVIYIYYGNPTAADGQSASALWLDAGYFAVYHANGFLDSTNLNNLTNTTSIIKITNVPGRCKYGNCWNWSAAALLAMPSSPTGYNASSGTMSVTKWAYRPGDGQNPRSWSFKMNATHFLQDYIYNGYFHGATANPNSDASTPSAKTFNLSFFGNLWNGTKGMVHKNGVFSSPVTLTAFNATSNLFYIGGYNLGADNWGSASGSTIDEMRFANVSRSNNWILAEYAQTDSMGEEEQNINPYDESKFHLYKWNGTWTDLNSTPDIINNQLTLFNLVPSSDYGILEKMSPNVSFSLPTPVNTSILSGDGIVLNLSSTDNMTDCYFEFQGINHTGLIGDDNYSCYYAMRDDDYIYNNTYQVTGYANVSGTYYPTNETRVFDYFGCGYFNQDDVLIANILGTDPNYPTCIVMNASDITVDCLGYSASSTFGHSLGYNSVDNTTLRNCILDSGISYLDPLDGLSVTGSYQNLTNITVTSPTTIELDDAVCGGETGNLIDNMTCTNASFGCTVSIIGPQTDVSINELHHAFVTGEQKICFGATADITNSILDFGGISFTVEMVGNFTVADTVLENSDAAAYEDMNETSINMTNVTISDSGYGLRMAASNLSTKEVHGAHFFNITSNETIRINASTSLSSNIIVLDNIIIDTIAGSYTDYSNISQLIYIGDLFSTGNYYLNQSTNLSVPSGYNLFGRVLTMTTGGYGSGETNWTWLDSQLGPVNESNLILAVRTAGIWSVVNNTPDTTDNQLYMAFADPWSGGDYALLEDNDTYPILAIESPQNTTYDHSGILVNLTATDSNLETIWFYNDSDNVTYTIPVNVTYADGTYILYAWANDTMGHVVEENVTFTVDTTYPTISITFPTNDTYASTGVALNYIAADTNRDSCWYVLDGGAPNYSISDCSNTILSNLAETAHNITVYVNDTVGHTNQSSVIFTLDLSVPIVNIQSPSNQTYNLSLVDINFTASDSSGIDSCWYSVNGTATVPLPGCANTTLTFAEGADNITIFANDTVNNIGSAVVYFVIDTIFPTIAIVTPYNATYNYTPTLLNISASDINLDTVWYNYDGGANSTYTTPVVIGPLADGVHTYNAWANDTAGNTNSTNVTFTVDKTAPAIILVSPANAASAETGTWTFIYNVTDFQPTTSCALLLDGSIVHTNASVVNGTADSHTEGGVPWGPHSWYVTCNDTNNTAISATRTFTHSDLTPPTISYVAYTDASGTTKMTATTSWIATNVTASDTNSGLDHITTEIFRNGILLDTQTSATSPLTNNWTGLVPATYTLFSHATDNAGNTATLPMRTVTIIHIAPPVVNINYPVTETSAYVVTATCSGSFATYNMDLYMDGTLEDSDVCANSVACPLHFASPHDCNVTTAEVVCTDATPQASSAFRTFTLIPDYSIMAPANAITIANTTMMDFNMTWTCTPASAAVQIATVPVLYPMSCVGLFCNYTSVSNWSSGYHLWAIQTGLTSGGVIYGPSYNFMVPGPTWNMTTNITFARNYTYAEFETYVTEFYEDYGIYFLGILAYALAWLVTQRYPQTMIAGGLGMLVIYFMTGNAVALAMSMVSVVIGAGYKYAVG